jgi:prevent-host-death family protein
MKRREKPFAISYEGSNAEELRKDFHDGVRIDRQVVLMHSDQYDHNGTYNMITEISAVSFRQNLGEMLNQVQYRHDSVVINKDGKPVAALVDARLFERIRRMQGRFDALCQRIEAGFVSVPEAEGLAEIDAAVALERTQERLSAKKP